MRTIAGAQDDIDVARRVSSPIGAKVVFLTHYIPLYQVRVLQTLAASIEHFEILLSTPIEPNRDFVPDWNGLDVTVQDTLTVRRTWRHQDGGFRDSLYVHFPYDTVKRLRTIQPDVVLSAELGARSVGATFHRMIRRKAKLVLCTYMSQRTEQGRGFLREQLRKRLVARADAVTYNGPSCKAYLRGLGVSDENLFHFPYAADDRTAYRGPVDRDDATTRHRLLVVGQLTQRKGTMPLVEQVAAHCHKRPERRIDLIFAGDGPLRAALERYEPPANLTIRLLGNVRPVELTDWMTQCGGLIASTLADEWMLVVNEALQAGLPVLGSIHSQAVTSLIEDGVNGWTYDPLQPGALADSLDRYFDTSPDALRRMRQSARASVAHCTPEWAAAGALDAIQFVLGKTQ